MKTVKTSSNPGSNKRYRILRGHKHLYLALLPALSLAPFATMTAKADTNAPVTGEFVENNIPITAPAVSTESADYTALFTVFGRAGVELAKSDRYTEESLQTLDTAINAVSFDKTIAEQDIVNRYVTDIEQALAGLQERPLVQPSSSNNNGVTTRSATPELADYTALNAVLMLALQESDKTDVYTKASLENLEEAINAVQFHKLATEQAIVNGYVDAINKALEKLQPKDSNQSSESDEKTIKTIKILGTDATTSDEKNKITYTGMWMDYRDNSKLSYDFDDDASNNPTATLKFTGKKVEIFGDKLSPEEIGMIEGAQLDVFLNNKKVGTIDARYKNKKETNVLLFASDELPESEHVLKLVQTSGLGFALRHIDVSYTATTTPEDLLKLQAHVVSNGHHYKKTDYERLKNQAPTRPERPFAYLNDQINAEVLLFSQQADLENVTGTASDFMTVGGVISADHIKVQFLKDTSAHIARGGNKFNIPKAPKELVPDVIDKATSVAIPAKTLQGSWVTISVPKDAKPGVYTGTLTYKADNDDKPVVIPYSFEVLPMEQPESNRFSVELWQYPYTVARYYGIPKDQLFGEEHLAILRQQLSEYQKVGGKSITATVVEDPWNNQTYDKYPSMVKWTKKADGSFTFDFDHFDKYVNLAMELGIDQQIKSFSIAPWENRVGYTDETKDRLVFKELNPVLVNGKKDTRQEWKDTWGAFLTAYIAHLDEKGWFDKAYIALDERPAAVMQEVLDLLGNYRNKDGKTLKLSVAIDHYEPSMKPLLDRIDDISVSMTEIDNPARHSTPEALRAYAKERRERGQTTTMYSMVGQYPNAFTRSAPAEAAWVLLYAHSLGLDGYLRWAYDAWVKDPLTTVDHWWWESGDPFLVYPGDKDGSDKTPRTSPRFEHIKEAERLIEKIRWIKEKSPEAGEEIDQFVLTMRRPEGRKNAYGAMESTGLDQERQIDNQVRAIAAKVREVSQKYQAQLLDQSPNPEQPTEQTLAPMKVFSLDAGRKYFNLSSLKSTVDTLSEIGFTDFHLILGNDGLRFFLDDMSLSANGQVYTSDAIKEALTQGNIAYEKEKNSQDDGRFLTQAEMDELIAYTKSKNLRFIPTINSPGHMDAIVTAIETLGISDAKFSVDGKTSTTTLNLNNDFAVNLTKSLVDKYAAYFSGKADIFNIGLDEYANDITKPKLGFKALQERGEYHKFVAYANDLAAIVKKHNLKPMAFNDGIYHDNVTTAGTFDKDIIVSYWTAGWGEGENRYNVASPNFLSEKGHKILNTNDNWYYVIGRNTQGSGWYNLEQGKDGIAKTPYHKVPGDSTGKLPVIGAMVAVWADEPRRSYSPNRVTELLTAFADRNPEIFDANYKTLDTLLSLVPKTIHHLPADAQKALTDIIATIKPNKTRAEQAEVDAYVQAVKSALLPYLPQKEIPTALLDLKIFSLDAGRKYFSPDSIKSVIDKISDLGYTDLHLLLGNDGLRFVLDDMSLLVDGQTYTSDAVKTAIQNGNKVYYDDPNGNSLTQAEMQDILAHAASRRINLIPTINSPGHMDAILEAMTSLGIKDPKFSHDGKTSKTTIDLTNEPAVNFTKALIKKYVDFFSDKVSIFNIGLDEYANDATNARGFYLLQNNKQYDKFVSYANDLSAMVKAAGLRPMAFNDGVYYNSNTSYGTFDQDLIISYWTSGWNGYNVAKPDFFYKKGHHLINTNDAWYYVLGRDTEGTYNLESAIERIGKTPFNQVPGAKVGTVPTIGSLVAIWADQPSAAFDQAKFERLAAAFANANPNYLKANYNPLLEVLKTLPNNVDGFYTDDSYNNLVAAVSQVKWDKQRAQQAEVDAYTQNIRQAIRDLTYKSADYSALEAVVKRVPQDFEPYTSESLKNLQAVLATITYDKTIKEQDQVDAYVTALEAALNQLVLNHQKGDSVSSPTLPSFDVSLDHDSDGFTSEEELAAGTDPLDPASYPKVSHGGLGLTAAPKPFFDVNLDHDSDGFTSEEELAAGTDPLDPASYPKVSHGGLGLTAAPKPFFDVNLDHDSDGFTSAEELSANTDPLDPASYPKVSHTGLGLTAAPKPFFDVNLDHDSDGFTSAEELSAGTDPLNPASYPKVSHGGLGLTAAPKPFFDVNLDHDSDGFTSAEELSAGTDPLDPTSYPKETALTKEPLANHNLAPQGTATSVVTNEATKEKPVAASLPKTNDQQSYLAVIGMGLLSLLTFGVIKKRHH